MNGLRKRKKLKVVNFLRLRKPFIHPILILFTHVLFTEYIFCLSKIQSHTRHMYALQTYFFVNSLVKKKEMGGYIID